MRSYIAIVLAGVLLIETSCVSQRHTNSPVQLPHERISIQGESGYEDVAAGDALLPIPRYNIFGWIPIEMVSEDTDYSVHLFPSTPDPDLPGQVLSPWVIYFHLSGRLQDEDMLAFLRGEKVAGNPKLVEFALCFPDPIRSDYLGGRIETYSRRDIWVLGEWNGQVK